MLQKDICKKFGCSEPTIRKIVKEYGISIDRSTHYPLGYTIGRRTIIGDAGKDKNGMPLVAVQCCRCGKISILILYSFLRTKGSCLLCGHRAEYTIGDRYGSRTIIGEAPSRAKGDTMVKVQCDCGRVDIVDLANLKAGKALRCKQCQIKDAVSRRHNLGVTNQPWYTMWADMKSRCYNSKAINYHNYGGRGIKVCEEWHNSAIFGEWAMSHGYEKGLQLDRIDSDGDYCPENCRWVIPQVNCNNKRNNVLVTVDGITDTLANTCRRYGIDPHTVSAYKREYDISYEKAFECYLHDNEAVDDLRHVLGKSKVTHSMSDTRFYDIWGRIRSNCTNPNSPSYKNYGALGIKVCALWLKSFENFMEDMYNSYLECAEKYGEENVILDRIDINKDYCSENCRWVTWKERNSGEITSTRLTFNGETHTLRKWSEILNIKIDTICARFRRGKAVEDILYAGNLAQRHKERTKYKNEE